MNLKKRNFLCIDLFLYYITMDETVELMKNEYGISLNILNENFWKSI